MLRAPASAIAAEASKLNPKVQSPVPDWQRVRITTDRIGQFIEIHRRSMAGVANVPVMDKAQAYELIEDNQVDLIELNNGEAVGYISVLIDNTAHTAEFEQIGILPEWRSKGIGRAVMQKTAAELAAAGIETLFVLVASVNTKARALYEKLGFGEPTLYSRWFQKNLTPAEIPTPEQWSARQKQPEIVI